MWRAARAQSTDTRPCTKTLTASANHRARSGIMEKKMEAIGIIGLYKDYRVDFAVI